MSPLARAPEAHLVKDDRDSVIGVMVLRQDELPAAAAMAVNALVVDGRWDEPRAFNAITDGHTAPGRYRRVPMPGKPGEIRWVKIQPNAPIVGSTPAIYFSLSLPPRHSIPIPEAA